VTERNDLNGDGGGPPLPGRGKSSRKHACLFLIAAELTDAELHFIASGGRGRMTFRP
jgi:hypothetical protein